MRPHVSRMKPIWAICAESGKGALELGGKKKIQSLRLASFKYFKVLMLLASNACDLSTALVQVISQSLECKRHDGVTVTPQSEFAPSAGKPLFGTTPLLLRKADILASNRDRRTAS